MFINGFRILLVTVPFQEWEDFGTRTSQKTCLRLKKLTFGLKVIEHINKTNYLINEI